VGDFVSFDIAKLKAVAEAATPGPWVNGYPNAGQVTDIEEVCSVRKNLITKFSTHEDREHIATFNPATVLALLARLERLESEVETLRRYGNKDCTAMADEALKENEK